MNERSVVAALNVLLDGYLSNEQSLYFDCFSSECSVVLHTSREVYLSKADFEREWLRLRVEHGFRVIECDSSNRRVMVSEQFAIVVHDVVTSFLYEGDVVVTSDRETVVFTRDLINDRWLVCHEHLSPLPPEACSASEPSTQPSLV